MAFRGKSFYQERKISTKILPTRDELGKLNKNCVRKAMYNEL